MSDTLPTLKGAQVYLRPFDPSDIPKRLALGRSAEIVRSFGGDARDLGPYRQEDARRWVEENLSHPMAWAIDVNGVLLGGVRLDNINQQDRRARLAIGLYDPPQLGRGFGREAIGLVLGYAFGPLGLHRVSLRVLASNERAIRCYKACGFVEEGRERESGCVEGVWCDDVIMGVLAREYVSQAS